MERKLQKKRQHFLKIKSRFTHKIYKQKNSGKNEKPSKLHKTRE